MSKTAKKRPKNARKEEEIPEELETEEQIVEFEEPELNEDPDNDNFVNEIIKPPSMIVIAGKSKRGKSYLIKYLLTMLGLQKKFKFGLVFCKTKFNGGYDFFPQDKVIEGYSEKLLDKYMNTLKKYGEEHPVKKKQKKEGIKTNIPPSVIVFDDILGQIDMNGNFFTSFLSNYRHYNITVIAATQYIYKISPIFREQADIAIMFEQNTEKSIRALFETYGQHFENWKKWKKYLMEHTAKPYHCLIFVEDGDSFDERYIEYMAPKNYPEVIFKF